MEHYAKKGIKKFSCVCSQGLAATLSESSIALSLLVASKQGNTLERIASSYTTVSDFVGKAIDHYVDGSAIGLKSEMMELYSGLSNNFHSDPDTFLYTLVGTYVGLKATPHIVDWLK